VGAATILGEKAEKVLGLGSLNRFGQPSGKEKESKKKHHHNPSSEGLIKPKGQAQKRKTKMQEGGDTKDRV